MPWYNLDQPSKLSGPGLSLPFVGDVGKFLGDLDLRVSGGKTFPWYQKSEQAEGQVVLHGVGLGLKKANRQIKDQSIRQKHLVPMTLNLQDLQKR